MFTVFSLITNLIASNLLKKIVDLKLTERKKENIRKHKKVIGHLGTKNTQKKQQGEAKINGNKNVKKFMCIICQFIVNLYFDKREKNSFQSVPWTR